MGGGGGFGPPYPPWPPREAPVASLWLGNPDFVPLAFRKLPRNKCNLPYAPKKKYDKIARASRLISYNKKRNCWGFGRKLGSGQNSSSGSISGSVSASDDFETSIERGARRRSSCKKILGKGSKIKKIREGGPLPPPPPPGHSGMPIRRST